jgi:hypothetical protein
LRETGREVKTIAPKSTRIIVMTATIRRTPQCQPKFQGANINVLSVNQMGTIVAK